MDRDRNKLGDHAVAFQLHAPYQTCVKIMRDRDGYFFGGNFADFHRVTRLSGGKQFKRPERGEKKFPPIASNSI
jgi:hypothetical protein